MNINIIEQIISDIILEAEHILYPNHIIEDELKQIVAVEINETETIKVVLQEASDENEDGIEGEKENQKLKESGGKAKHVDCKVDRNMKGKENQDKKEKEKVTPVSELDIDKKCDVTENVEGKHVKEAKAVNADKSVTFNNVPIVYENTHTRCLDDDEDTETEGREETKETEEGHLISEEEFLLRWSEKPVNLSQTFADLALVKFWYKISMGRPNLRVFVPFGISSADIKWLYNQGNQVVVIHGLRQTASTLFAVLKMSYSVTRLTGSKGWMFRSSDHRITIFITNFWDISIQNMGTFDAVFDIDALAGLHKKHHKHFAESLMGIMKSGAFAIIKGLETFGLRTYEAGGSHCLSLATVEQLFGKGCVVTRLNKKKVGSKLYQNTFNLQLV